MPANNQTSLFDHSLEPRLDRVFAPMCNAVPLAQVKLLKGEVANHMQAIWQALRQNEFLDVTLAERIATVLLRLLGEYGEHTVSNQSLIIGATRYFIKDHDAESDLSSLLGFDDDVRVLNYVLESIGKNDLRIDL